MREVKKKASEEYQRKVEVIPDDVRDAVIEKWLSYIKCENLTAEQMFRNMLHERKFKAF